MKKSTGQVLLALICIFSIVFSGCSDNNTYTADYNEDDNVFVGTYHDEEDSYNAMTISYNGDSYRIELQLSQYGDVSCVGIREEYELNFTGTNSEDDFLYGNIEYEEDGELDFEIWTENYSNGSLRGEEDFLEIKFIKDDFDVESEYEDVYSTVDENYNADYIMNEIQGYWLWVNNPNNTSDFFCFEGENYSFANYPGEAWEVGNIEKVIDNGDGTVTLEVFCPALIYGYEVVNPEHTSVITLSSDDDFSKTMFLKYQESSTTLSLVYAGATLEEFEQAIGY